MKEFCFIIILGFLTIFGFSPLSFADSPVTWIDGPTKTFQGLGLGISKKGEQLALPVGVDGPLSYFLRNPKFDGDGGIRSGELVELNPANGTVRKISQESLFEASATEDHPLGGEIFLVDGPTYSNTEYFSNGEGWLLAEIPDYANPTNLQKAMYLVVHVDLSTGKAETKYFPEDSLLSVKKWHIFSMRRYKKGFVLGAVANGASVPRSVFAVVVDEDLRVVKQIPIPVDLSAGKYCEWGAADANGDHFYATFCSNDMWHVDLASGEITTLTLPGQPWLGKPRATGDFALFLANADSYGYVLWNHETGKTQEIGLKPIPSAVGCYGSLELAFRGPNLFGVCPVGSLWGAATNDELKVASFDLSSIMN